MGLFMLIKILSLRCIIYPGNNTHLGIVSPLAWNKTR